MIHIKDVSPVKSRTIIDFSPAYQSFSGKMKRLAAASGKQRVYAGNICGIWRSERMAPAASAIRSVPPQ